MAAVRRRSDEIAVIAIYGELRRIGVNVNQIARALNTAVMEGKVLNLELAYLEELRTEVRAHMMAVGESFRGNLAYWDANPASEDRPEHRPTDRPEHRPRL